MFLCLRGRIIIGDEERVHCPKCGNVVSRSDRYYRVCAVGLSAVEFGVSQPGAPTPGVPAHERRFGFLGHLYRFVVSPSDGMQDVALAPDYAGVLAILMIEMILSGVAMGIVLQKFQFVGTNASQINDLVSSVLGVVVILAFVVIIVQWLVKSALVWASCKSRSNWSFKTAAVVTGYAYFADLVVGLIGVFLVWLLLPTYVIDTSNLTAAQQSFASLEAKLMYMRLLYSLPLTFFALIWKSYLGGLGSHHGTSKLCSVGKGFAIFFLLGLIGVLGSFVSGLPEEGKSKHTNAHMSQILRKVI